MVYFSTSILLRYSFKRLLVFSTYVKTLKLVFKNKTEYYFPSLRSQISLYCTLKY